MSLNERIRPFFVLTLLAAFVMLALMPDSAFAYDSVDCDKYVGLTNHIAGCIRETLKAASSDFFVGIYPILARGISGVMILAVAIFGCMAAFGMLEKPGRDVIMLLIKIAFVSYFATQSRDLYNVTMLLMDAAAQEVVGYIPTDGKSDSTDSGDFSKIKCMDKMATSQDVEVMYIWTLNRAYTSRQVSGPWLAMDCLIDTVIGIRVANEDPDSGVKDAYNSAINEKERGLARGMLYFFFSSMQSSVMGLILALVGLVYIWGMLQMIVKALFIYLAGYLGLAVMLMFAPLFIPMVLFQSTKNYFDRWIKLIISFSLQPVIILVFVAFSIAGVDLAMFSGDYSVMYRIAGEEARKNGFSLNSYLTCVRAPNNPKQCLAAGTTPPAGSFSIIEDTTLTYGQVKSDQADGKVQINKSSVNSMIGGLDESKCIDKLMDQDPDLKAKCSQSYPLQIFRKNIRWDLLAKARTPDVKVENNGNPTNEQLGEQISREIFAAVIFAAIVIFVMNKLLAVIPVVSYDLIGDFGQSPNLAKVMAGTPGGGQMSKALSTASSSMVGTRGGVG